jgi:hypothetical protein
MFIVSSQVASGGGGESTRVSADAVDAVPYIPTAISPAATNSFEHLPIVVIEPDVHGVRSCAVQPKS